MNIFHGLSFETNFKNPSGKCSSRQLPSELQHQAPEEDKQDWTLIQISPKLGGVWIPGTWFSGYVNPQPPHPPWILLSAQLLFHQL